VERTLALELKNNTRRQAACLSILGTGSDVGKSIVTTALCRYFVKQGIKVAPYKAQNMSNNSGVTPEGLEMGRAQIVQAEASKIPPHVDMNPILLKPTSEIGSQVILLGSVSENTTARDYHHKKERLFKTATEALKRLRERYELIVMEGAGSCAPVILVADIHRGGVFAQIIGTLACLNPIQQDRVKGFIINRFRGDIRLFESGIKWIEEKTAKKVFGVLPWYDHINIEPEDSVVIEKPKRVFQLDPDKPSIAVIRLPHISNFNDFDPLFILKELEVYFLEKVQDLSCFCAVILPGSKNTRFDLNWLHATGWTEKISAYAKKGGHVMGICGGYQMMGDCVHDPDGLEGSPGSTAGLGLLPTETVLKAPKTTTLTKFSWQGDDGSGYEIHMGQTEIKGAGTFFEIIERNSKPTRDKDGCVSADDRIMGTYIHGVFDNPKIISRWLNRIGASAIVTSDLEGHQTRDKEYNLLAEHFETHIDTRSIMKMISFQPHEPEQR
jgi:adenosylcobyric acid synthase